MTKADEIMALADAFVGRVEAKLNDNDARAALRAAVESLEAENERLRKDAARYLALREQCVSPYRTHSMMPRIGCALPREATYSTGEALDAAIRQQSEPMALGKLLDEYLHAGREAYKLGRETERVARARVAIVEAFRAAPPQQSEPVAWLWLQDGKPVNAFLHKPDQRDTRYWEGKGYSTAPLYAAPVQQSPLYTITKREDGTHETTVSYGLDEEGMRRALAAEAEPDATALLNTFIYWARGMRPGVMIDGMLSDDLAQIAAELERRGLGYRQLDPNVSGLPVDRD